MTHDPLKAMFDAEPAPAPARDLGFVLDVMKRVEQRRLYTGLVQLVAAGLIATFTLYLVMPYLTPALMTLGAATLPAVLALSVVVLGLVGIDQARKVIKFEF